MVFKNSRIFMVFKIQIYSESFCYSMWPWKIQDYKLSYVRSKNLIRFTWLKNSEKLNCLKLVIKNLKNSIKMTRLPLNGISYGKIWFLYIRLHTYNLCKWYVTYRGLVTYCVIFIRHLRKGRLLKDRRVVWSLNPFPGPIQIRARPRGPGRYAYYSYFSITKI